MVSGGRQREHESVGCGRTVAHDQGSLLVDSLLRDGWAQIVGEEDGLVLRGGVQTEMLLARSVEVAQEQANVVPGPVGDLFRVPGVRVSARHIRMAGSVAEYTVISEHVPPPG